MNNQIATTSTENDIMLALKNSVYPGARDESIQLVQAYCRAAGLDPIQKPVHIVPMWDKNSNSMRDVIMPGIGLYRIQASRSEQYAGVTEPEFGEDVTEAIGGAETTYPKWCRVTVKRRMADGTIAEFTAKEFWRENYAVKGGKDKSVAPNAMWAKRPYGQIAKCAEAQALRKAFPEIGAQPTAEEMEGKSIEMGEADVVRAALARPVPEPYPDEKLDALMPAYTKLVQGGTKTPDDIIKTIKSKYTMTAEQENRITDLAVKPVSKEPDDAVDTEWGEQYDKKTQEKAGEQT